MRLIERIAKRPLFGILAANYEELRAFRRMAVAGAISGIVASIILTVYGKRLISRLESLIEKLGK